MLPLPTPSGKDSSCQFSLEQLQCLFFFVLFWFYIGAESGKSSVRWQDALIVTSVQRTSLSSLIQLSLLL